jgi:hypothetical protein
MPNGKEMMDDLKFETQISEFSEPEKFLARQIRKVEIECALRKYCAAAPQFSRKQLAVGGGAVTLITAIVALLIELIKLL